MYLGRVESANASSKEEQALYVFKKVKENTLALQDAIVVWGDEEAITTRVKGHLDAGADHVCIQTLPSGELDLETLRRLAPALLEV